MMIVIAATQIASLLIILNSEMRDESKSFTSTMPSRPLMMAVTMKT